MAATQESLEAIRENDVSVATATPTSVQQPDVPTTATPDDPVVTLVMPTMNEADGIADCIANATAAFEALGVPGEILVSDSSTDATPEIARALGARVVTPDRRGYGYAYRYAFRHARGEYIVIGDADTTYDFTEIPRLLDALQREDADMVLGSRFAGRILPGAMPPLHQYLGNPGLTAVLNLLYRSDVSDAHSGFRILTRDALERLDLRSEGMEFASEMIMEATAKGLHIVEVPITYHVRKGEATLASFRDGWRHVKFMLVNAPGALFATPGSACVALGVLLLGFGLASVAAPLATLATVLVGSTLLLGGVHLVGMAFVVRAAGRPIRAPNGWVMQWLGRTFTVERGLVAGGTLAAVGLVPTLTLVTAPTTLSAAGLVGLTLLALGGYIVSVSLFVAALERR
ncbi:Glycosyltransferase involved in cell wall bisynthesis [Halogranum amylolyticum]|uniref:Glycosyltransferase involved in cell wall bisynthesis n=1 Tax=Halogranum amylolyticum TaxID=660520 RepID=A0A1H8WSH5_9EURY|nr:glycosyltransferase family 2 protein [Halogranum amylolyticum]SEP30601.1 Glycosyltransferase involved in cell wall bisynthesis [Halogranum amylolyticum]